MPPAPKGGGIKRSGTYHFDDKPLTLMTKLWKTLPLTKMFIVPNTFIEAHHWSLTPWWRNQMETFSAILALCEGDSPVIGEFHSQKPVTQSFDVFFDLCLNKRLSKQSRHRWLWTQSRSLWRHSNALHIGLMGTANTGKMGYWEANLASHFGIL